MRIAESAKTRAQSQSPNATHDEMRQLCEYETIKVSLDNLRTFPWIQRRIDDGILTIQGWYFDIETGEVQALDETTGQFAAL